MKTDPAVYSLLMNTIYLSLSTQVAEATVFRDHTVGGRVDGLTAVVRIMLIKSLPLPRILIEVQFRVPWLFWF